MVAIVFDLFLGYEGVFFIAFCARKIYSFLQGKGSYDGVCLYLAAGMPSLAPTANNLLFKYQLNELNLIERVLLNFNYLLQLYL
jgi:hypothetical protein